MREEVQKALMRVTDIIGEAISKRRVLGRGAVASSMTQDRLDEEGALDWDARAILREELEREVVPKCNHDALWSLHDGWKARAEKAEADLALLREELERLEKESNDHATAASHFQHDLFYEEQDRIRAVQRAKIAEVEAETLKARLENTEAVVAMMREELEKLARFQPLIEAVEKAEIMRGPVLASDTGHDTGEFKYFFVNGKMGILNAALKCRAEKRGKEKP